MNRMEEMTALQAQLDQMPAGLENTLARAERRLARRSRRIWRSVSSLAAGFVLFVALVNFCMPVAYACSRVPVLRELAEAVTFSQSLTRAVDNEYVQPIDLVQTQNGITASVEYLIVDQKQVTVFYRFRSEQGDGCLTADAHFFEVGTREPAASFWGANDYDVEQGKLQSATMEIREGQLPRQVDLELSVYDPAEPYAPAEPEEEGGLWAEHRTERLHLAVFTFPLTFDPGYTEQGQVYPLDQTVEIDGQKLILTQMEIYPTHMRICTENHPDNTALITGLEYQIRGDWGIVFEPEKNGITSFGDLETKTVVYRADSPWFCRSDRLELVINQATILDKDMGRVCVDLQDGTVEGRMPEGVELVSVERQEGGDIINFKAPRIRPNHNYQCFKWNYYDADGNEYQMRGMGSGDGLGEEIETHFGGRLYLRAYPYDEVWLEALFSRFWFADKPVAVTLR